MTRFFTPLRKHRREEELIDIRVGHLFYGRALRAGICSFSDILVSTSVTYTTKGGNLRKPFGGSPSVNSLMLSDMDRAGELSWRGSAAVDLASIGLKDCKLSLSAATGDTPDSGKDASPDQFEYDLNFDFRPNQAPLENLWLRVRWAENFRDSDLSGRNRSDLRVIANYSVDF